MRQLEPEDFGGPVEQVSRELLGCHLVRDRPGIGRQRARIVEVEAYGGPEDLASHARRGRTPRSGIMFGPPGRVYVYLIYGMHHCLNLVTGNDGEASAILIRALEPIDGITGSCAGPGRLCRELGIDRTQNGTVIHPSAGLWIEAGDPHGRPIGTSPRIGIDYAAEPWRTLAWRFFLADSPGLSVRGKKAAGG